MRKWKRLLGLLLAGCLFCMCLAGCGNESVSGDSKQKDSGKNKPLIGVSLPSVSTSLNELIGEKVTEIFPECEVQVASAESTVSTQVQQIQNYVTMGAEMIVVVPVELEAIIDVLEEARSKDVKVVVSGATVEADDAYDAVTVSNEYLVGCYVAKTAKLWAEENMQDEEFDTLIFADTSQDDAINRVAGISTLTEPYLKNVQGEYIDENGNVVDESQKIENPVYCEKIANGNVYTVEVPIGTSGRDAVSAALAEHPNIRCVLCYTSLTATEASQYIVDTYSKEEVDKFGCFGGGVIGSEYDYLIGAASDEDGTKSVLRGAVAFGGDDVAQGVAELAYNVFYGEEGVDYQRNTAQSIGVWFSLRANEERKATVACVNIANENTVSGFTYEDVLTDDETIIYWKEQ